MTFDDVLAAFVERFGPPDGRMDAPHTVVWWGTLDADGLRGVALACPNGRHVSVMLRRWTHALSDAPRPPEKIVSETLGTYHESFECRPFAEVVETIARFRSPQNPVVSTPDAARA